MTVALALAVTEDTGLDPEVKRFVAVLATGFVLFTLFVNGTTLRGIIRLLKLDRAEPATRRCATMLWPCRWPICAICSRPRRPTTA